MPSTSEPEKYSIEEMMERLQSRTGDEIVHPEGELVSRADGSQAIKVRRRKRRTSQPHKQDLAQTRRARVIQVSASLILLFGAILGCGIAIVYANSAPFRDGLVKKINVITGAEVELNQFRMTPSRANAGQLVLSWPEGNVIKSLNLRGFSAEIAPSSFFGKSMEGEYVTTPEATLTLRNPDFGKPARFSKHTEVSGTVDFGAYSTPNLHVIFGESTAVLGRIDKAEASFLVRNPSGRPQLLLNRGDITIPGWPNLKIDRSHIEFRGSELDIIGLRLRHENDSQGALELSGTLSPYNSNQASTLAVQMQAFPIAGIAGPEWGRLFNGKIDTTSSQQSNFLSITPAPSPESNLMISFSNSLATSFRVTGFPFLFALSQLLNDKWFERPVFESDVSGIIRRQHGNVRFEDLNFISKGRMSLRGNISMGEDRKLSGNLEVGVAEGMISDSNLKLNAMFGPVNDGFRWMSLTISGNGTTPTDNFRQLYDSATSKPTPHKTGNIPSFEELTTPGKE
ncbi:MAG: hypothetical protein WCS43_08405 [Verrucomicrobiota bacterium]